MPSEFTLYLTRHGETFWNSDGKIQTWSNGPGNNLTGKGKSQADQKGKILQDCQIKAIYHSDLNRARDTARIINSRIKVHNVYETSRLRDGNLTFFDGLTTEEIKRHFAEAYTKRSRDKFNFRLPAANGFHRSENIADIRARVKPILRHILHSRNNTLIVGHRSVNRAIIYHLCKGTRFEFSKKAIAELNISTSEIFKFRYCDRKLVAVEKLIN